LGKVCAASKAKSFVNRARMILDSKLHRVARVVIPNKGLRVGDRKL